MPPSCMFKGVEKNRKENKEKKRKDKKR